MPMAHADRRTHKYSSLSCVAISNRSITHTHGHRPHTRSHTPACGSATRAAPCATQPSSGVHSARSSLLSVAGDETRSRAPYCVTPGTAARTEKVRGFVRRSAWHEHVPRQAKCLARARASSGEMLGDEHVCGCLLRDGRSDGAEGRHVRTRLACTAQTRGHRRSHRALLLTQP